MSDLTPVDLTDLADTVGDLAAARQLIKELQEQEKAAVAAIKDALGDATVGTIDGKEVVRLDRRMTSTLDKAVVKAMLRDDQFAAALKHTAYSAVRLIQR